MQSPAEKLTGKKARAITALLAHGTQAEAAAAIRVAESTLWRWLQEPAFCDAFREARRKAVQAAIARAQQVSSDAIKTLEEIMADSEAPASARVSSAKTVLETAIKAVEIEDLEARISALEEKYNGQQH